MTSPQEVVINTLSVSSSDGWTEVKSRKKRNNHYGVRFMKQYWNGFDKNGEKWFIELSDGKILSHTDSQYQYWQNRHVCKVT
jgi:hypothetical protein